MGIIDRYLASVHIRPQSHVKKTYSFLTMLGNIKQLVEPGQQFAKDSIRLIRRCTKPDQKSSRRSLWPPPLDSPSWALLDFLSSSSTSPSITSSSVLRELGMLFGWFADNENLLALD